MGSMMDSRTVSCWVRRKDIELWLWDTPSLSWEDKLEIEFPGEWLWESLLRNNKSQPRWRQKYRRSNLNRKICPMLLHAVTIHWWCRMLREADLVILGQSRLRQSFPFGNHKGDKGEILDIHSRHSIQYYRTSVGGAQVHKKYHLKWRYYRLARHDPDKVDTNQQGDR